MVSIEPSVLKQGEVALNVSSVDGAFCVACVFDVTLPH